ncbi:MAG: L,D-transpeptidase [Bacteroidota bacterium]
MKTCNLILTGILLLLLSNCTQQQKVENKKTKKIIQRNKPATPISYHYESGKQWVKLHKDNASFGHIIAAVNRADIAHLTTMDSIIIPNDSLADIAYFLPFPVSVPALNDIDKIIFFSYPAQAFAAYENGELVYAGPTSMGRKNDPTPTGLFFTNWKAETTTSTFNDEWELKWNFNIANKLGVGWHEYEMPGYPASHSCLRLLEKDARYLYDWADQWVLSKKDEIVLKGTPVIVFGSYDFAAPKPWKKLVADPHALDISEEQVTQIASPYLQQVITEQNKRNKVPATSNATSAP